LCPDFSVDRVRQMTKYEPQRAALACVTAFDVQLRSLEKCNLSILCHWRNQPEIRPYMEDDRPVTPKTMEVWFNKVRGGDAVWPYIAYMGERPVGYTELKRVNRIDSSCEGGMFLFGKEYIGAGIGYNIVLCREIVMAGLGLRTLISRIRSSNTRSISFCTKYGGEYMRTEGDFLIYTYEITRRRERLKAIAGIMGMAEEFVRHFEGGGYDPRASVSRGTALSAGSDSA